MIKLSNGHVLEYVIASGALAFDGKGWPWERPLVAMGLIQPELFTITTKSLTLKPREGNLKWWKPWTCVRTIPGGAVNKVGLTNPGFDWWRNEVAPMIDFEKYKIVVSLYGTKEENVIMAKRLNNLPIVGIEVNDSCPNTGHGLDTVAANNIENGKAVAAASKHPVIYKVSAVQPYKAIAEGLKGHVQAISINSVPWETVFGKEKPSPLLALEKKVGGGGGGVSGRPAQETNWRVVSDFARARLIPVIGPGTMRYEDMHELRMRGARAISFGTIHLPDNPPWLKPWTIFTNPIKPTRFVQREMKVQARERYFECQQEYIGS
jgi:dihydroorotate dehydrogenase